VDQSVNETELAYDRRRKDKVVRVHLAQRSVETLIATETGVHAVMISPMDSDE
jgi:hypothetical protein